MTYENAVLYSMLLIMYEKGDLDIEKTKAILIDHFGEEGFEKIMKKLLEIIEKTLDKSNRM